MTVPAEEIQQLVQLAYAEGLVHAGDWVRARAATGATNGVSVRARRPDGAELDALLALARTYGLFDAAAWIQHVRQEAEIGI